MPDTEYIEALRARVTAALDSLAPNDRVDLQTLGIGNFAERRTSLHHYTTADGLLGIVNQRVIYATSAQFLNDYSEILYGLTMANDAILAIKQTAGGFFDHMFLNAIVNKLDRVDIRGNFHIVCFCEKRDLLSQWRGYGANGGYSLDFHIAEMLDPKQLVGRELVKVLYDRTTQKQLIESLIQRYYRAFREVFELDKGNFSLALH